MFEIFSYWIFVWFILFYFNITKYNPLFILIIGYLFTFLEFVYLISNKINLYNGFKFFIINVIIKFVPIIIIINMKKTIIKFVDIIISFYLFLIYIIVMLIFHKNPYEYYKNMINTYLKDDNNYKSSFNKLYDYLYNSFIKFIIYR
jgi:hypothetical protein